MGPLDRTMMNEQIKGKNDQHKVTSYLYRNDLLWNKFLYLHTKVLPLNGGDPPAFWEIDTNDSLYIPIMV